MFQLSLTIHGEVQGVNFRWYAHEEAVKLGLTGWVTNNEDGSVSIVAEGVKDALQQLATFCQKGPRWAEVEKVDEEWRGIVKAEFENFSIKW